MVRTLFQLSFWESFNEKYLMEGRNQISLEKKKCCQCRYFTYLNPHVCETLNLSRNPFSLWFRLRLGYGVCMRKKKMIRRGVSVCSDYEKKSVEKRGGNGNES